MTEIFHLLGTTIYVRSLTAMSYVLDTNIFNRLLDGRLNAEQLPRDGAYLATHVQIDEINRTKDAELRAALFLMFTEVRPELVPTESFVADVSRLGYGKLSDGVRFGKLKQDLDALNKSKANNANDVLIAEVAIANNFTLLTADRDLAAVVKNHGGKVVLY